MEENCSNQKKCCCSCHQDKSTEAQKSQDDGMTEMFLHVADEAWMEVLKDKIKEHILSTQSDKMAELAKIVSEANNHRWKNKMEKKQGCCDFKEKLNGFFGRSKK